MALMLPLQRYWPDRGLLELGLRIVRETLARGDQSARTVERSRSLAALSDILYFRGAYAESLLAGRDALESARELGDSRAMLMALDATACAAYASGEVLEARTLCEEYERESRARGDVRALTSALTYLGEILRSEGDLAGALRVYDELVPLAHERGDMGNQSITYANLAMIRTAMGDLAGARRANLHAVEAASKAGSKRMFVASLDVTATSAVLCGQPEPAARFFGASERAMERTGAQREPADAFFTLPLRARAEQDLGADAFAKAYAEGRELPLERAFAEALDWARAHCKD